MRAWARAGANVGAIGVCLLLAACQGKSDAPARAEAPAAKPAPAPAVVAAPAPVAPPAAAEPVEAALAATKAYNAQATAELTGIGQDEARLRTAATRALEAARGAESASEGQRKALSGRVAAARRDADAARDRLMEGQARLAKDADVQVTAAETALESCAATPELVAYPACQALEAEHALLLQNIQALTARYQAADAAFTAERAKLEEASAAVALAALR